MKDVPLDKARKAIGRAKTQEVVLLESCIAAGQHAADVLTTLTVSVGAEQLDIITGCLVKWKARKLDLERFRDERMERAATAYVRTRLGVPQPKSATDVAALFERGRKLVQG